MQCGCEDDVKFRNYYRYYDSPDGCDIDKKIMATTRYGIITGLILASYDVLMYSHAVGLVPIIKRYLYHAVPLGLMGATFAAVSNGVMRFRQRDDHLNYFAGGLACGPILAAYLRSGHGIVAGGLLLGIAGMVKKDAIDSNFVFVPPFPEHYNSVRRWRYDFTVAKDPRDEMIHTCKPDDEDKD